MSLHILPGQVMLDIAGTSLSNQERDRLKHPNTGGVILFTRNYENPGQLRELIQSIRLARHGELLVAVDHEGGRVQRFQNEFTRLPAAAQLARSPELAQSAGWLMAAELLALGVDFSFAPVLDLDHGVSAIIGDRAFAGTPHEAAKLAGLFRKGMKVAGMAAVGKHFPGHGGVAPDSHLALPVDNRDLDSLRREDLLPFKQLISEGLEAIMPAHIVYPNIDAQPAGFSHYWIGQILRTELNFQGVVFSDDLCMEGAASAGSFADRARLAQQAGCDMLLVCNNPTAAEQVLESLPTTEDAARTERLLNMRGRPAMDWEQLHQSPKWLAIAEKIHALVATNR